MIDKQLSDILAHELQRQSDWLELIASENYVSKDVMAAYANVFTNKYSEWLPGARYYGGNEVVDELESLTQERALQVFGLDADRGVNVQSLSGSPANAAVYLGVLKPGDTVLAMDLNAGWHLSHGHKLNISAAYYNFVPYGVQKDTLDIDYDEIRSKAMELKPVMIVAWFSAYPKNIDRERFAAIADEVSNTHGYRPILMADISHIAGLIAGGVLPTPFNHFDIVTTTTHKTLRGPRGALIYYLKDFEKQINRWVFPWLQWWPHEHVIFAKAVALSEVLDPSFKIYANKVVKNAKVLAAELVWLWWSVLTWTTENHIILLDVTVRNNQPTWIAWQAAEYALERIGVSVNKNLLPFDTRTPKDPSGLRLWTPAITTRWLWEEEMKLLASIISRALEHHDDDAVLEALKAEVIELCKRFPLRY